MFENFKIELDNLNSSFYNDITVREQLFRRVMDIVNILPNPRVTTVHDEINNTYKLVITNEPIVFLRKF